MDNHCTWYNVSIPDELMVHRCWAISHELARPENHIDIILALVTMADYCIYKKYIKFLDRLNGSLATLNKTAKALSLSGDRYDTFRGPCRARCWYVKINTSLVIPPLGILALPTSTELAEAQFLLGWEEKWVNPN